MNTNRKFAAFTAAALLAASIPAVGQGLGGALGGAVNGGASGALGGSLGQGGVMGGGVMQGGFDGGLQGDTGGLRDGISQGATRSRGVAGEASGRTRGAAAATAGRTRSAADQAAARSRDSSAEAALGADAAARGARQATEQSEATPSSNPQPRGLALGLGGSGDAEMAGRRTGAAGDAQARAEASRNPLSVDGNFGAHSGKAEPAEAAQPTTVSTSEKPVQETPAK